MTTQYIGSRYVPILADPVEWSNTKNYEPLTIVTHEGNSYTSRQFVPVGIDITNDAYWAITGNYNAQIELYRRETAQAVETCREYTDEAVAQVDEWLANAQGKYSSKPFAFDTVANMQAAYDLLYVGAICHTNGFHASGDGGAAWYVISDTGTANAMDVLACGNLFANLIIEDSVITPEMLGANANGLTDDTQFIARCIELCNHVILRNSYGFAGTELKSNLMLEGEEGATIRMLETHLCLYATLANEIENVTIKHINFIGTGVYAGTSTGEYLNRDVAISVKNKDSKNIVVSNCTFTNFGDVGIRVSGNNSIIEDNQVFSDIDYSSGGAVPNYSFGIDVSGDNLRIENNTVDGYIQCIITGIDFTNSVIIGNNIKPKHQHGMYIEGGQNIAISNNIVVGYANSICGIKIQNSWTNVMDTFIVSDNIVKAGEKGQAILVTTTTNYGSVSNVKISNNMLWGARGVELSSVFNCDINNNTIEVYNVGGAFGIRIGNILDKENGTSDIHIIGNTIKGHCCIYIAPAVTQNTKCRVTVCDNTILFYDNAQMAGIPFAIDVMRVSNFICSGNAIKGISVGAGRSGLYMEPNTIEKIGVIGNYINGFASDIRIGSAITEEQRAKINYNLYDTSIGL